MGAVTDRTLIDSIEDDLHAQSRACSEMAPRVVLEALQDEVYNCRADGPLTGNEIQERLVASLNDLTNAVLCYKDHIATHCERFLGEAD